MVSNNPDLFGDVIDLEPVIRPSEFPVAVAQHVLWHFGDAVLGRDGGDFITRLLRTFSAADKENRAKLAVAYPEYMLAFRAVGNEHWGLGWLRDVVRKSPAGAGL